MSPAVQDLIDKFDGQLPGRRYDAHGVELLSSRIWRAIQAEQLQLKAEAGDPRLKAERQARIAKANAEERAARVAAHETAFWREQPSALRDMGLPDMVAEDIAGMDDTWPAWRATAEWLLGAKPFLVLGGDGGTGKTVAASRVLASKCMERVKSESFEGYFWRVGWGRFVRATDLSRRSYYDKSDRAWMDRLGWTRWLVLDDLGAETMSAPWLSTLFELLDTRLGNQVRTIITTNVDGDEFAARYDKRVMRRLKEQGTFVAAKRPGAA